MVMGIKDFIRKKDGNFFLWLVIFINVFIVCSVLIFDYSILQIKSKRLKFAVNQATKASVLAVNTTSEGIVNAEGEISNYLAEGYFLVDPEYAKYNFYQTLCENLSLNNPLNEPSYEGDVKGGITDILANTTIDTKENSIYQKIEIEELKLINVHPELSISNPAFSPLEYTSNALNKKYEIQYPSVLAVVSTEIKGAFLKKKVTVGKLASSQLKSLYDD